MNIKDQALKRLETGLTLGWLGNPKLKDRAVEIIESLAAQLEAKGESEEYTKGFQDVAKEAVSLRAETVGSCSNCVIDCETSVEPCKSCCVIEYKFCNFTPKDK